MIKATSITNITTKTTQVETKIQPSLFSIVVHDATSRERPLEIPYWHVVWGNGQDKEFLSFISGKRE